MEPFRSCGRLGVVTESNDETQAEQSFRTTEEARHENANVGTYHRVWKSDTAFIVSTAAAAIGLGNFWRFPYLLGEQGGGAFLIAYLVCLLVVALPIAVLELSAGRRTRSGVLGAFSVAGPRSRYFGYVVLFLIFLITSYYLVLTGWTFSYALDALDGDFQPFDTYQQGWGSLVAFLLVLVLACAPLFLGVGAIEKVAFVTAPTLLVVLAGIGAYAYLESDGWGQSVEFLTGFEGADLMDASVWYKALGQSFYSLMIGQGYLLTYGRHVAAGTNLPRAAGVIAIVNAGAGISAGFVLFPFVFASGADPAQGPELIFAVLPNAISEIPFGYVVGVSLFIAFFLAAFTSCVASLKTIVDGIFGMRVCSYRRAMLLAVGALLIAGLPSALSYTGLKLSIGSEAVLDWVDNLTGSALVIFAGIVGAGLLFGAGRHRRPPS